MANILFQMSLLLKEAIRNAEKHNMFNDSMDISEWTILL